MTELAFVEILHSSYIFRMSINSALLTKATDLSSRENNQYLIIYNSRHTGTSEYVSLSAKAETN